MNNKSHQPPYTLTPAILRLVAEISENNTLTLEQVTAVIDGKQVLGHTREIQEVKNAFAVYGASNWCTWPRQPAGFRN